MKKKAEKNEKQQALPENKKNISSSPEEAEKIGKKKISKRTKLAIIASVCAVVVIAAIIVPIIVVFGNKTTIPTPFFSNFDDDNDYYIRVKWDKISGADSYSYVYFYGTPEEADSAQKLDVGKTNNTVTAFSRRKGTVSFKVKANIAGEITDYSDWISINVSAWKLNAPVVTFNDDWSVSWVHTVFKIDDTSYQVNGYEFNILLDGVEMYSADMYLDQNFVEPNLKKYILDAGSAVEDKISGYLLGEPWQDIDVEVRVKAVTYIKFANTIIENTSLAYENLDRIYMDSDYGTFKFTITEEIFNNLN